jgi:hypothetical protein
VRGLSGHRSLLDVGSVDVDSTATSAFNSSRPGNGGNSVEDKLASAQRVIRKLYRKSIELSSNLTQIVHILGYLLFIFIL